MKKRVFDYLLIILLCLSLMPLTVFAAEATISLDKTVYAKGERIVINVSGITQQMVDDSAFIAVYVAGATHDEWGEYTYVQLGDSQCELTAPNSFGSYEVRLYRKDHEYTDETFVTKVPFTVGVVTVNNPGKIALDKSAYIANTNISVKASGITEQMALDKAFVAIYKKGAEHDQYGAYAYPKAGDSTIEITAPNLNGNFEMRLYSMDHYYSDATFVMSVPFTLSGAKPPKGSTWSSGEVEQAELLGLFPDSLKSSDLTIPITREEFAEIAVRFYEIVTGNKALPHPTKIFKDTSNPEILKAFNLDITAGSGDGTIFEPKKVLIRQQMAAMITRTLKASYPSIVFDITGQPDFKDQSSIASYAATPTKFMAKHKITVGDGKGSFFPNDNCTREQAVAFLIRAYNIIDTILGSQTASDSSVVGTWVLGTLSGGKFNATTGKYEGGAAGLGQVYNFKSDGTYTAFAIWSNAMFFTGKYSIKDGVLTCTNRFVEESDDDGATWEEKEALSDASAYFEIGTDTKGKYLMMGEEGTAPPLVDTKNALKYYQK